LERSAQEPASQAAVPSNGGSDIDVQTGFWNETPFRTYLFDALSLLIGPGEDFLIAAVDTAASALPVTAKLRQDAQVFIEEERNHTRAHALYNQTLAGRGYDVQALPRRVGSDLEKLTRLCSLKQRLALAGAFEHVTSVIARAALTQTGWLSPTPSRAARLWRWHCEQELAHPHAHVTLDLMRAWRVSAWLRLSACFVVSLLLLYDVMRQVLAFHSADRHRAPSHLGRSALQFVSSGPRWGQVAAHWFAYFQPLSRLVSLDAAEPAPKEDAKPGTSLQVRFLQIGDLDALLRLESQKWEPGQAANAQDMAARIHKHPTLCLGAFDPRTGEVLASLFMKPTSLGALMQSANWNECAASDLPPDDASERALFGISFSSVRPEAGDAIFEFFWPHALKAGWRHIYLGSPIPGFKKWLDRHPDGSVYRYVHSHFLSKAKRRLLPRDPQLRYYTQRGFRHIVYIRPDYFPHAASLNYGVLVRGTVPLSAGSALWRRLPLGWLQRLKKGLFMVL
jgi:predicted metal-dependent hydrolase